MSNAGGLDTRAKARAKARVKARAKASWEWTFGNNGCARCDDWCPHGSVDNINYGGRGSGWGISCQNNDGTYPCGNEVAGDNGACHQCKCKKITTTTTTTDTCAWGTVDTQKKYAGTVCPFMSAHNVDVAFFDSSPVYDDADQCKAGCRTRGKFSSMTPPWQCNYVQYNVTSKKCRFYQCSDEQNPLYFGVEPGVEYWNCL